jgi:hypothetical protein
MNKNYDYKPAFTIAASVVIASTVFWGVLTWAAASNHLGLTQTGQIGDTSGGIFGPFLNLAGLVLVYISFKEQLEANKIQHSHQAFELTFEITEKFIEAIGRNNSVFADLPKYDFGRIFKLQSSADASRILPLGVDDYTYSEWQFNELSSYFNLIVNRLPLLTIDQRQVVVQIISNSYGNKLRACWDSYVYHFNGVSAIPGQTQAIPGKSPAMMFEITRLLAQLENMQRKSLEENKLTVSQ